MHLEMTGREWVIRLHDDLGGRDADLNGFAGRVLSPQEDSVIRLTVVEDARHFVAIRVHFCPRPIPAPDLPALDAQSPVHFCTQDPRARFSSLFSPPHNLARRSPFPVNPIPVALDPADATTCSTSPTRVAIGLAADCAYVDAAGGPGAALARILVVAGRVGQAYQTAFNIELVVTRVEIPPVCGTAAWNRGCALNDTLESRLQAFGQWRMGRPNDGVATWHLFTRCSEGATVGLAWYATLCETGRGFDQTDGPDLALARAVGVSVSSLAASGQEWQTMAHELGS
ncbi:hypothetical protein GGF31_005425 [Allomyces arbusculus]|nr:hypothetical protein GGF31_005425 [Allomyces arbusculus]